MEAFAKLVLFVIVFCATFYVFTNIGNGTSVELTSSSSGATMTTRDIFGNTSVCKTTIIGSGAYATSHTSCN